MKRIIILTAILAAGFAGCSEPPKTPNSKEARTPETKIRFADATAVSGVNFQHVPTLTPDKLLPEVMGSGVVIADFGQRRAAVESGSRFKN